MDWLSLLPPVVAIAVAVWLREVIGALLVALLSSELIIAGANPAGGFGGMLARVTAVFDSPGNARILMFSLLVGALIAYIRESGGVSAVVQRLMRLRLADSPRKAGLMTNITGVVVFIETNMSLLTAGILSRGLFDRFQLSRARLAYLIDSTCAPISVLILFNGWGAYILSLVEDYTGQGSVATVAMAVPLNFYAWTAVILAFYTAISTRVYGPLRQAEQRTVELGAEEQPEPTRARYMALPIIVLIGGILVTMWVTGDGNLLEGNGSLSVLAATVAATLVAYGLLRADGVDSHRGLVQLGFRGMGELLPVVTTVLLALALGASMRELGTGEYVAGVLGPAVPVLLITPLIFIAAGIVSFTTGTSWGTFGLMIPIAMPLADALGLPPALALSAVLGGGVFGDHCSPISDTTIIASLGAGCDHFEHVRTQLPYALTAGVVTIVLYLIAGATLP